MQVVLKYVSEKTYNEAYDLFLNDLKQAITANAYDPIKLEEIRQDLLTCQAFVEKYQYQNIRRKAQQDEMDEILSARNNVITTSFKRHCNVTA